MTYEEYVKSGCYELAEMIESNSRKPVYELLKEGAYLRFFDDEYRRDYCENNCPHVECPCGCNALDFAERDKRNLVYGADMLIGAVLRRGYQALGVSGINEPFEEGSRRYADIDCADLYNVERGICAGCEHFGKASCPEDILSAECPRSGNAWAVERITETLNDVIAS